MESQLETYSTLVLTQCKYRDIFRFHPILVTSFPCIFIRVWTVMLNTIGAHIEVMVTFIRVDSFAAIDHFSSISSNKFCLIFVINLGMEGKYNKQIVHNWLILGLKIHILQSHKLINSRFDSMKLLRSTNTFFEELKIKPKIKCGSRLFPFYVRGYPIAIKPEFFREIESYINWKDYGLRITFETTMYLVDGG